ncbi:peptidylprolyl isomerase [Helicobacter cappadocius]|uniref:SurA N-terminal domain-containing protein n=1 Tax=Helicobacter cappadocius TaxID=3063998 RepID=A0AA90PIA0_9HELI|nr:MULTISPECIES: peptidylprolyl isomerase [unclassified Helicobacter]MDO7253102.1 SurA N-terminal domain-containing protein [Helicobacter sp. faydin-H75]MDP2538772.1 SurA N-terminal domain-containing protein [Helicobacter sp. faydin-H76]
MIEWMQKHRKYLVITIWISSIAFIVAGGIGWGQFNLSTSLFGDTVIKVGNIKISSQEFEQAYNNTYQTYAQALGGNIDPDEAKKMGLDKMAKQLATQILINQALVRNFALDLGLRVEDSEVIDEITKTDAFQNNGHFDEAIYKATLKENNYRPVDFEKNIREMLLLQKMTNLFPDTITPLELDAVSSAFKLQDKIELSILDADTLQPKITDSELKAYWEKNKDKYKTPSQYEVQYRFVDASTQNVSPKEAQSYYNENKSLYINDKGELESFEKIKTKVQKDIQLHKALSVATKEYLDLKKSNATEISKTITEGSNQYPPEIMQELQKSKTGQTLKPLEYKNGYIILKLISKKEPEIKTFEQAKIQAILDFTQTKKMELLKLEAQNKLSSFKGKDIGFVNVNFKGKIQGLDEKEVSTLIKEIFINQKKSNFVIINNKAILYRIKEQNFNNPIKDNSTMVAMTTNLKTQYLQKVLIDYLRQKYTIQRYQD